MTLPHPLHDETDRCEVTIWQSNRSEPIRLVIPFEAWPKLSNDLRARQKSADKFLYQLPAMLENGDIVVAWCIPECISGLEVRAREGRDSVGRLGYVTQG